MQAMTLGYEPAATAVRDDAVRAVYQPIVDLMTGEVVAYEALARWPGLSGVTPDVMFDAARRDGRLVELDWECRLAALDGALAHDLGRDLMLFVNIEPATLGSLPPVGSAATIAAASTHLRVVLELTERALTARPAELLGAVQWARRQGWAIALDDVGSEPESLALLPFLEPDVIKLDMSLIRDRPDAHRAAIMAAVMAHAERTGAVVLAEGIEIARDLDQALALGATLGQGWFFGRPGPFRLTPAPTTPMSDPAPHRTDAPTPFALVADHPGLRTGRKGLLLQLSNHIESQGMRIDVAPVVASSFQTADRFTPATARRYGALADRCPLVCTIGVDLDGGDGVLRTVAIDPNDPLVDEWTVTVVGNHYAGALIARDLGDDGPDHERRFEFVVTHDRDLVVAAARSLMTRVTGTGMR